MRAIAKRLCRLGERLAAVDGELQCPAWVILIERMSRHLAEERGAPFEEVFQQQMREHQVRHATRMAGYKGDGSPVSTLRWLMVREREKQLATGDETPGDASVA